MSRVTAPPPLTFRLVLVPMSPAMTCSKVLVPLTLMSSKFASLPFFCGFGGRSVITAYFPMLCNPATAAWLTSQPDCPNSRAKMVGRLSLVTDTSTERLMSHPALMHTGEGARIETRYGVFGIAQRTTSAG